MSARCRIAAACCSSRSRQGSVEGGNAEGATGFPIAASTCRVSLGVSSNVLSRLIVNSVDTSVGEYMRIPPLVRELGRT